jgi:hypothetical protein
VRSKTRRRRMKNAPGRETEGECEGIRTRRKPDPNPGPSECRHSPDCSATTASSSDPALRLRSQACASPRHLPHPRHHLNHPRRSPRPSEGRACGTAERNCRRASPTMAKVVSRSPATRQDLTPRNSCSRWTKSLSPRSTALSLPARRAQRRPARATSRGDDETGSQLAILPLDNHSNGRWPAWRRRQSAILADLGLRLCLPTLPVIEQLARDERLDLRLAAVGAAGEQFKRPGGVGG